jgi:hypothetical protein
MAASRGRGYSTGGRGPNGPAHGNGRGRRRGHGPRGGPNNKTNACSSTSSLQPECQVYEKIGHTAKIRWYRYHEDTSPEPHTTVMASSSGTDPNWYTDFGTTDHIPSALNKLTMHDPYFGTDQIHAANGSGMDITRIGKTIIPTPSAILSSIMFFMFLLLTRILSLFIVLPLIMIPSLNFIRTS